MLKIEFFNKFITTTQARRQTITLNEMSLILPRVEQVNSTWKIIITAEVELVSLVKFWCTTGCGCSQFTYCLVLLQVWLSITHTSIQPHYLPSAYLV